MRDVAVAGAGMTRFAKYPDRGLKDLTREAVEAALDSAGMDKSVPQVAIVGNAAAGVVTGQESIRAQVVQAEAAGFRSCIGLSRVTANRVPMAMPSAPKAKAATNPLPSQKPPAAITGTFTLLTTIGSSTIVEI